MLVATSHYDLRIITQGCALDHLQAQSLRHITVIILVKITLVPVHSLPSQAQLQTQPDLSFSCSFSVSLSLSFGLRSNHAKALYLSSQRSRRRLFFPQ